MSQKAVINSLIAVQFKTSLNIASPLLLQTILHFRAFLPTSFLSTTFLILVRLTVNNNYGPIQAWAQHYPSLSHQTGQMVAPVCVLSECLRYALDIALSCQWSWQFWRFSGLLAEIAISKSRYSKIIFKLWHGRTLSSTSTRMGTLAGLIYSSFNPTWPARIPFGLNFIWLLSLTSLFQVVLECIIGKLNSHSINGSILCLAQRLRLYEVIVVEVCYHDLSKVFGSMCHRLLLKLRVLGLTGRLLNLVGDH